MHKLSPEKLHFVGIGGIGMSGLAAMCKAIGMEVSGSDRGYEQPENQRIIRALRNQGIAIYPQDGSFAQAGRCDKIIYSTAIEEDNPDFVAAGDTPRVHRSQMLAEAIKLANKTSIAVTGSCGKSTVTAYLAETLFNLGEDVSCLNGGLVKRFISDDFAGNYRPGNGQYFIFEADESDKSLVNYHPDYAVILNMGTDHYSKEELIEVFTTFLHNTRRGAVIEREVYEALKHNIPCHLNVQVFDTDNNGKSQYAIVDYNIVTEVQSIYAHGRRQKIAASGDRMLSDSYGTDNLMRIYGMSSGEDCRMESKYPAAEFTGKKYLILPQNGRHNAANALAILSLLEMLQFPTKEILQALATFHGVWRRNDFAGFTPKGAMVYDDYAHNPEKIASCIQGMRETANGNIYAVFQPHGYKPFGFMRDQLFLELDPILRPGDRFILLPPFYAGGTSSFKPTSEEVCLDWQARSAHPKHFMVFPNRELLTDFLTLQPETGDIILVMGARDNSLSDYAVSLTNQN